MMKVVLRKATDEDKEFLQDLNRKVYREVVAEQYGNWDDDQQSKYFDQKWQEAEYQIIEIENQRIGTIWTVEEKDHIRIRELQILPEFQGQGIGTVLMKRELEKAKLRKLPVRLSVLKANRARIFYERLGFRIYDETGSKLYLENGLYLE
jgi:GNAT superfamily N-acetyltransferase